VTLLRPPAFVREVRQAVEASRRHGRFDMRWPSARSDGAVQTAPLVRHEAAEALDWEAFSKRYFPGRSRHNMEALTAYHVHAATRMADNAGPAERRPNRRLLRGRRAGPEETGTRRQPGATAANQM
jgi:hypothetical protein